MTKNFLLRLFSSLFLAPSIILLIYLGNYLFYLLLLVLASIGIYEILKIKKLKIQIIILFLFLFFIYSSFKIINLNNGNLILIFILLLTWASDIGGYIFGKTFGGKKINIVSPNKTYSGFAGSLILVQLFGFYLETLNVKFFNEIFFNNFFLLICTFVVIMGDLFFSYFKRECDLKDYSNIIPGHGGLFDRIDGLILLTIFIYLIVEWKL